MRAPRGLVVAAAVACALPLSACGGDGGTPGDYDDPVVEAAHARCVERTNQLRADNGRPAVVRDLALEAYANDGAAYDHDRAPHDHFGDTGGGGIAFAENECPHWDLAFGGGDLVGLIDACLQAFYDEGPGGGHHDIMLGDYGTLGCGIYQQGTDTTIIQDYGQ